MLGQKVGQYRVIERLGAGGMGRVYRAVDDMLGRDVALKVIETPMENAAARLRAEAAALARVNHPGIATVYELLEDDGRLVMAMELVRGETVQHLLDQVGMFSPRRAADLCMQALTILEHAHAASVVHRDLKPGNLMITESGALKIMDFGIARLSDSMNLTSAGTMLGTPAYMAPEQVLGHPIDARADLYAMGVVLFRLVTGGLPFKGENPFDMAQSQVNDPPAKATDLRADLPPWVDEILTRALAKKPIDRFQTAAEFHQAFERAISHDAPQPHVAPSVEVTEVLKRPDFSKPAVATAPVPAKKRPLARPRPQHRPMFLSAAAVVVAVAAWLLIPFSASTSDHTAIGAIASADKAAATPAPAALPDAAVVTNVAETQPVVPAPTAAPKAALAGASPKTSFAKPSAVKAASDAVVPTRAPATFSTAKFLAVDGPRTATTDVLVQFSETGVSVHTTDGKSAPVALPYRNIVKATYSQGRDPKWDPALSGPGEKLDMPGILGMGRTRYWLALQGPDRYVILRLDGEDRLDVMKAFEERSGIVVDRRQAGGLRPRRTPLTRSLAQLGSS